MVILLSLSVIAKAQDNHVTAKYNQNYKITLVAIDPMFLAYTDDWRLAVDLSFSYPKQRLERPPKHINFGIRSLAKEVKYPVKDDRGVTLLADGVPVNMDNVSYIASAYEFKKDHIEIVPFEPQIKDGKVVGKNDQPIKSPIEESFATYIKPEDFLKLAKAKSIGVRIGNKTYNFTINQMQSIRSLARLTIPNSK